jgi:hypothetical protein
MLCFVWHYAVVLALHIAEINFRVPCPTGAVAYTHVTELTLDHFQISQKPGGLHLSIRSLSTSVCFPGQALCQPMLVHTDLEHIPQKLLTSVFDQELRLT